jgi:drug/metabolite transporter (DMT)-like permease
MQVAFSRHVLATAASLAFLAASGSGKRINAADLPKVAVAAMIGIPLYFYFENTALLYTSAAAASMITAVTPAIVAVADCAIRRRVPPATTWLGILVSGCGVYFVVQAGGAMLGGADYVRGNLMILVSATAWAAYTIINRPLIQKYGVPTTNAYQITLATVVLGVLAPKSGLTRQLLSPVVLLNLAYLGILCSALAYAMYLFALRALGSTTVTVFINLVPVFGVLGSALVLGEPVTGAQLVGGCIVLSGILAVNRSTGQAPGRMRRSGPVV